MESFKHRKKKNEFRDTLFKVSATNKKIISSKISQFSRMGKKTKRFYCKFMFKEKDLMNKIGDEPRCYWTGRKINLDNGKSYQLDHFVPKSKGGDNSLENCVLACKEANQGRSDITSEDYIKLSCEVAVHKGKEILAGMLAHDNEFREFLDEKSKLQ